MPNLFTYPGKIVGYVSGKSLGRHIPHGAVGFIPTPFTDGDGSVTRNGENIGYLARDPECGWKLLDVAGNTVSTGIRHSEVIASAAYKLPSAGEQHAYIEALEVAERAIHIAYGMAAE